MPGEASSDVAKQVDLAKAGFEHLRFQVSELERRSGQLVTATAFFLTATVTLLNNQNVREVEYIFDNGARVRLTVVLLVLALLFGTFAIIHAVLAVGPQVRHYQHVGLSQPSFLSFLSIAEREPAAWSQVVQKSGDLAVQKYMRDMYAREAAELSKEAQYRYGRLGEVRAFLFLAVSALAMSLVLVLDALSVSRITPVTIEWTIRTALGVGLVLALLTYFAGEDRLRIEDDGWVEDTGPGSAIWVLRSNGRWLSLTAGLTVVSIDGHSGTAALALLSLVPPVVAITQRRRRYGRTFRTLDHLSIILLLLIGAAIGGFTLIESARVFLLVAAVLPLFVFEGIRLVYVLKAIFAISRLVSAVARRLPVGRPGAAEDALISTATGALKRTNP